MNNHNQYFHQCENNPRYTKIYKSVQSKIQLKIKKLVKFYKKGFINYKAKK